MFYYATDVGLDPLADRDGRLRKRLHDLVTDALSIAEQADFDVFNALTLMDNVQFLEDLKVGTSVAAFGFVLTKHITRAVRSRRRTTQLLSVQLEDSSAVGFASSRWSQCRAWCGSRHAVTLLLEHFLFVRCSSAYVKLFKEMFDCSVP
jgi:hypothetical protein